jgi:hypothetical protein
MPLSEHIAPAQALGYFFQLERALSWLAKAPANSVVGIETEDDVVLKLLNGHAVYEQDKSSTSSHPFLPSRKDLWKTLLIWADAIVNGEIDIDNSLFYLVTNKSSEHSIASTLSDAKNDQDVTIALAKLKNAGSELTGEVKILVDNLFLHGDEIIKKIIQRITYESGNTVFGEGLLKKLQEDLQLDMETPEQNKSIINELTGWVFNQVVGNWRNKKPALIDRNSFHRQKITILTNSRQMVLDEVIIALGKIPEQEQRSQWSNRYVKQLQLIKCERDDIFKAIHEYLNSVVKRSQLARKGYLTNSQLEEFDKNLENHWNNIFKSRKISMKHLSAEEIGQVIYFDTTDYNTSVGKYVLNNHFITKGSYHALADKLKIGWHPEYSNHFKEKGKEKNIKTKKNA